MNRDATDLAGVRHLAFETLGSTNAEALARARAGERGPLWISAAQQTRGHGRRGRSWSSPPGNLYATLLLTEPSAPSVAAQLSFVAGLAAHDAVAQCAPNLGPALQLKWPNDLLLAHRKLAGLLIEAENVPAFSVAIGVGINCASHPSDSSFPATDLKIAGVPIAPDTLLGALAQAMTARLVQWSAGAGFAAVRGDWLKRAAGLGRTITVRLPEREFSGEFRGIDDGGALLVDVRGELQTIGAGEVFALAEAR